MILNVYAVLSAVLSAIELPLGFTVVTLGLRETTAAGSTSIQNSRRQGEDRGYLLIVIVPIALTLSVLGWPLLYALLQSYVPEWPGAMCIYGVTRIGLNSAGSVGYLPKLLSALQVLKPALLFAAGAWFLIDQFNRQTSQNQFSRVLGAVATIVGVLLVADAGAQGAYLAIPKKDQVLTGGCCSLENSMGATQSDSSWAEWSHGEAGALLGLSYVFTLGMAWGCHKAGQASKGHASSLVLLALGALVTFLCNGAALKYVVAPRILGLPYHHCVYDLIPRAPEGLAGITLSVLATFCVGWAALAGTLPPHLVNRNWSRTVLRMLLRGAQYGYLYSLALFSLALVVA